MKQTPSERDAARLFEPSKFSGDGFLGTDTRPVEQIIAADRAAVDALGTTCEAIAEQLAAVYDLAERALGDPVDLRNGMVATHFESRGKSPSPFRGDGLFPKGEVVISGGPSNKRLRLTRLGISMIRNHGFFQGRGSPYRIEPEDAAGLFD
jgi:hypothetical protein